MESAGARNRFNSDDNPTKQTSTTAPPTAKDEAEASILFECNICLDMASQPVITLCGHLFCWPW